MILQVFLFKIQNYQMNQHQNLQFAYKRFKSCKKGRILRLVLSPSLPSSTFPLSWGSLMSRSLAITQRTQRRATHIIMGLHILLRVYSSFALNQSLYVFDCYAFIIVKKMYIYHKHDTIFNDFKNLQKRLYLCGTITLQLELRKHSYISNMAYFLSLHAWMLDSSCKP